MKKKGSAWNKWRVGDMVEAKGHERQCVYMHVHSHADQTVKIQITHLDTHSTQHHFCAHDISTDVRIKQI
jgi:hypothetical protein